MSDLWLILPGLFAAGLAGSGHCFGMCGGLAALAGNSNKTSYVLWMNLARISSYTFIGLMGGLSIQLGIGSSEQLLQLSQLGTISRILSGILLILLAISMAGWRLKLAIFHNLSTKFWSKLQPLSQRLLPINNPKDALLFGSLWGWLPCGLIYAVLPAAWLRADALESSLMMFCFGLGTLPSMLAMGVASARIRLFLQRRGFRWLAVGLLTIGGLWLLYHPILSLFSNGQAHH